jgi:hypothetical protein
VEFHIRKVTDLVISTQSKALLVTFKRQTCEALLASIQNITEQTRAQLGGSAVYVIALTLVYQRLTSSSALLYSSLTLLDSALVHHRHYHRLQFTPSRSKRVPFGRLCVATVHPRPHNQKFYNLRADLGGSEVAERRGLSCGAVM